jgi:hypothetical protein
LWTGYACRAIVPFVAKTNKGHIQRLPSGSFRIKVYAGTDPVTGKERLLTSTASTHVMRAAGQCETIAPRGCTRATTAAALTPAGR